MRLGPAVRKQREEARTAKATMGKLIQDIIDNATEFKLLRLGELEKITRNTLISKNLRRKLTEIIDVAKEYEKWRHESWQIVNTEVRRVALGREFKKLDESLRIFGEGLVGIFSGQEYSIGEAVYQAVYDGNLTFELARDSILKHRWEQSAPVGEETITLKDIVEGAPFHKFIEELQQLHNRESLKMLREVRKTLLENAKPILKETT